MDQLLVDVAAGGFEDEVGFPCSMSTKSCRERAEPFSDIGRIDVDGGVGLDPFPQRRDCDGEVEKFLVEISNVRCELGIRESDLVEEPEWVVVGGQLGVKRGVECVDRHSDPMEPCAVTSRSGCCERVLEHV